MVFEDAVRLFCKEDLELLAQSHHLDFNRTVEQILQHYEPELTVAKLGERNYSTSKAVNEENKRRITSVLVATRIVEQDFDISADGTQFRCLCTGCKSKGRQFGKWNALHATTIRRHLKRICHLRSMIQDETKVPHTNPHACPVAAQPPRRLLAGERPTDPAQDQVDLAFICEVYAVLGIPLGRGFESEVLKAALTQQVDGRTAVSPLSTLYSKVPLAFAAEIRRLLAELNGASVSIACDGASFFGIGRFGVLVVFVLDGKLVIRSLAVTSGGSKTADALANNVIEALRDFDLTPARVVSISGDAENTNLALFAALGGFGISLHLPCFSHLLSNAGKRVHFPALSRLQQAFTAATANSYRAGDELRRAFKKLNPGMPAPGIHTVADTRFHSMYTNAVDTLLPYLRALELMAKGRKVHARTTQKKTQRVTFTSPHDSARDVEYTPLMTALLDAYLADAATLTRYLPIYERLLAPVVNAGFSLESTYVGPLTAHILSSLLAFFNDATALAEIGYAPSAAFDATPAIEYVQTHLDLYLDSVDDDFGGELERPRVYKRSYLFYQYVRFLDPLYLEWLLRSVDPHQTLSEACNTVANQQLDTFKEHPWSIRIASQLWTDAVFKAASTELSALLQYLNGRHQPGGNAVQVELRTSTAEYARFCESHDPIATRAEQLFRWWHSPERGTQFPIIQKIYQTVVTMMPSNCAIERRISSWRDLVTPQQSSSTPETFETMCILYDNHKARALEQELALRNTIFASQLTRKRTADPDSARERARARQKKVGSMMQSVRARAAAASDSEGSDHEAEDAAIAASPAQHSRTSSHAPTSEDSDSSASRIAYELALENDRRYSPSNSHVTLFSKYSEDYPPSRSGCSEDDDASLPSDSED